MKSAIAMPGRSYAPRTEWTQVAPLGVAVHARTWTGGGGDAKARAGDKPPIVFVHGLGLSSRSVVPLGRRLAALGYDVLAPDMPGFGRTRPPAGARWPAGPNVREEADQLLNWMDARGVRRAVLFGNSVGSQVATDIAVRFPDRVDRLILKGPSPDPRYRWFPKQYARVMMNMPFEAPSFNAVLQAEYASSGPARMVQQGVRTVDDRIETKLPRVRARTLVVRGRHDKAVSQGWAEEVARLLPDGRLAVIDSAAHNVQYTAPDVTARLVDAFLQGRLDDASAAGGRTAGGGSDVVVPRRDQRDDPLAPPKPVSTLAHGVLDYAMAALCLTVPRALGWGPPTQRILAMAGATGLASGLLTDYECGVARKIPMTLHLNLDASTGLELLLASTMLLRGEPAAGRRAVAAVGLFQLLAAAATRTPMGPARLCTIGPPAADTPEAAVERAPAVAAASAGA